MIQNFQCRRSPPMSQLRTIASTIVLCLIGISGCGGDGNTSANSVAATPGISVFAGKVGGYGNLNGSVKTARFDYATDVAVDSAGNLFVAEFSAVRKISSDGVVTTFVGKSDESGSIDGTGSSARFLGPLSLAIDGTDTLYVAESGNGTLRKITPSGTVTTFVKKANGLENPIAIALDQSGFVYVSDRNAILKISPAGVINSLAGANDGTVGSADGVGNAARFQFPQGIAVDNAGTVFVADSGNGTIRKITSDGVVTTLAGLAGAANDVVDGLGSAARFTATNGIEVDRNGTIFVTDLFAKTVRKITSAGLVSTFAGVTSRWTNGASIDGIGLDAGFIFPTGMTIDGRGNLFVIDATSTVRKVTQTTKVTTIAGSAPNPGYADGPGPAAMFNSPRNLAIDLSGNLYVADYFNNLIRKISPAGIVSTLAGNPSAIQGGSVDGLAAVSMFNAPQGVAVDQSGYVYVADTGNNSIRRISPAGIVATLAILTTTDSSTYTQYMNGPVGIAVNKTGDIFTANSVTGRFHRIRLFANGVVDDQSYLPYEMVHPRSMVVDNAGNLYVANVCSVLKVPVFGPATVIAGSLVECGSTDGAAPDARFNQLSGLAIDSNGTIFVSDTLNHTIRKISTTGVVTTVAGTLGSAGVIPGVLPGGLNQPVGMAIDATGALYTTSENAVLKIVLP